MQPNDREDSSQYVNDSPQPARVQPEPIQPAPPAEPRRKKGRSTLILVLLLLLALGAAASLGWLWYQQNGRVDDLEADLSSARNNVARLESAAKAEDSLEEAETVTDTNSTGSDSIIEKAIEYSSARTGNQGFVNGTATPEGKIDKQTAQFARVTVSSPSSPGTETIYLKATTDGWVVIGDGTEDVALLENGFGLPKAF